MKVAYVDIDIFAKERFSSGLFKYIRAILLRFEQKGDDIRIFSFAYFLTVQNKSEQKIGMTKKIIGNIPVEEYLLPKQPKNAISLYVRAIHNTLNGYKPDIIFINSAAVFLDETNISILKELVDSKFKIVMFVVDNLFPTYSTYPKDLVNRYYNLIRNLEVISCSSLIIRHLYSELRIKAKLFLNLISPSESISTNGKHKFISMVNIHPIKGIDIFDRIAKKLSSKKFLIIKNWPDVPIYKPPSNVLLKNLYLDVREFYKQTRILLVPSLHDEGQPSVITEAMLNGIPVIANAIGGIPEIKSSPGIFLIKPPKIKGFTQKGTILYPNVNKDELDRVVDLYIRKIVDIDKGSRGWERYSEGLKKQALINCQRSETNFEGFYKRWKSEINRH